MRSDDKGTRTREGDHATLTFRRVYPHAPHHVWDAIATPEGLRGWLMCSQITIEPRVGGQIEMVSGPPAYHSTGRVLVWDPPHVLEYEWHVQPVPEMPRGEQAIFRFALTPDGDSTQLVVTYRRLTWQSSGGFLPGLHAFLDRLAAQLAGRALPDWQPLFEALQALYPEWNEHASNAGK